MKLGLKCPVEQKDPPKERKTGQRQGEENSHIELTADDQCFSTPHRS